MRSKEEITRAIAIMAPALVGGKRRAEIFDAANSVQAYYACGLADTLVWILDENAENMVPQFLERVTEGLRRLGIQVVDLESEKKPKAPEPEPPAETPHEES